MYQLTKRGHTYIYDVNYGEDFLVSRIIVRSDVPGPEGLFLVKQDGSIEPAEDLDRFGPNAASSDGFWPNPPREAVRDAAEIARAKVAFH